MAILPGVAIAYQADGTRYYRASITYDNKHISLGSFVQPELAHQAYEEARTLLNDPLLTVEDYSESNALSFAKYVTLVNFRSSGVYIKTPILLAPQYFLYYLSSEHILKFDKDDLFFYSSHTIQQRGGYLFVCHYGSQYSILSRYGIRKFAVEGRDYIFANGDNRDYRYQNIKVINHFMGVTEEQRRGRQTYTATIHINGNYIIGRYSTEEEAAIAYNKAADILNKKGFKKQYIRNYITSLSKEEYLEQYKNITISEKLYSVINPDSPS